MVAGLSNQYIRGVGKLKDDLLILIEIEKVLTVDQLEAIDEMHAVAA
jgi:chemotaxis signal transduction protein